MNKKACLSLLVMIAGCNNDLHANPLAKTAVTSLAVGGAYVLGVMDLAFYLPHLVNDVWSNAGLVAATTAVYSAPVYIGFDDQHDIEESVKHRKNLYEGNIKNCLASNGLNHLHEALKNRNFAGLNGSTNVSLLEDVWKATRLHRLAREKNLNISGFPTDLEIWLGCACLGLPPVSFVSLCCGCPKLAAAILSVDYGATAIMWTKKYIEKRKWNAIIHEIDRAKGESYKNEANCASVDAMIQDVMTKRHEAKIDLYKHESSKKMLREEVAWEAMCKHFSKVCK